LQKPPHIRIAQHDNNNAKVIPVASDTGWVSSADFGKTTKIEPAVAQRSCVVFKKTLESLFNKIWIEAEEMI
jgi:hypothetical protein